MPRVKKEKPDTPIVRKKNKEEFYNEGTGRMFPIDKTAKKIELDNLIYQPIDDKTCKLIGYKVKTKIKSKLVIPDTVKKYKVVSIGMEAFSSLDKLKEVILPNGLIEICPKAFTWCTELISVKFPETLKYIGYFAFENCGKMFSSINDIFDMPNSLEVIWNGAFLYCWKLDKVIIGKNLKYIGNGAFDGSFNLKYVSFEKNKSVRLGRGVFYNCTSLKTTSKTLDMSII